MRKHLWIGLLAGGLLSQPSIAPAAVMIKPGLWEVSTTIEMPGVPFQQPPQTVRQCVTPQEAEDVEKSLPISKDCKLIDFRSSENKVNWKVECTGKMAGEGEGDVEYMGETSYKGITRIQSHGMSFHMKHKATRVGECP